MIKKKSLRILSLGAGVQSTTLALMIEKGQIAMVDCAIFADTGGEPKAVYDHLDWLEKQLSYPVHRVQWRNLKEDVINGAKGDFKNFSIPFYSRKKGDTGKGRILRRQCTRDYKISPVIKKIRELLGYAKHKRVAPEVRVEQLIGISYDELQRQRKNHHHYLENIYPLVDQKIRRNDCLDWIKQNDYPEPPRSACTFCPYHSNKEWLVIKKNKKEWEEVVEMDKMIRGQRLSDDGKEYSEDELFLHRDCKPIDEIDLEKKDDKNQYSLLDECEGMCGN